MKELFKNDDLKAGKYYHCFSKVDGSHTIHQCFKNGDDQKYIGLDRIWADDYNDQAFKRWRIFNVKIPQLNTIGLCNFHNGMGFSSDCALCNSEL